MEFENVNVIDECRSKKLETEFSKSKTLFLAIFDQRPLTVRSFFDGDISGVIIVCKNRFIQR